MGKGSSAERLRRKGWSRPRTLAAAFKLGRGGAGGHWGGAAPRKKITKKKWETGDRGGGRYEMSGTERPVLESHS